MTRSQRRRTIDQLSAIWTKRDIPAIELGKLIAMDDETLVHLHRFWAHKDRWWNVEGAPEFAEPAPNTANAAATNREPVGPPVTRKYVGGYSRGRTVFRQQIKKHS